MKIIHVIVGVICLQACEQYADSEIVRPQESEEKILATELYAEGDSLFFNYKYDSAISVYKKASTLADKVDDFELFSNVTNDIGLSYKKLGEYDSALKYYRMSADVDMKRGDSATLIGRWRNIGNVLKNSGRYSEAVGLFNKGLIVADKIKSRKNVGSLYNSIGGVYLQQGRNQKAIKYYSYALTVFRELNQTKNVAYALNNLGASFEGLKNYDSALGYYLQAKELKETINSASLASTLHNIGSVFDKLGVLDSSFSYLSSAFELREALGDQVGMASTANALGGYYLKKENLDQAKYYLAISEEYAVRQDNRTLLLENYQKNATYFEKVGDAKQAFKYLKKWSTMKDSVFNEEKLKTLEIQYDFELGLSENEKRLAQKETQIAEVGAQKNLVVSAILLIVLFLVSGFSFVFYQQRRKQLALNEELHGKNEKIKLLNKQNLHFTKNSLAGIVSMINSQTGKLSDGKLKSTLTAERLRMETINMLYKRLFLNGEGEAVEIKAYFEELIDNTVDAILGINHQVEVRTDIADLNIANETALNLGMIANEICLNACKYAFQNANGSLTISLQEKNEQLVMNISDNGKGLPENLDWESTNSFGIQLIRLLCKDLGGKLDVSNSNEGLAYHLEIPFQTS